MADIADKLDEARALIEKGWCQGAAARDATGKAAPNDSHTAVSVCALGAVDNVTHGVHADYAGAKAYIRAAVGQVDLVIWNDTPGRTQAEVIEAFKKAAELARAEA